MGECEVLASLDSPFIISLRACFQDKSHIYLILDLVEGGEIYEHLLRRVSFDEESLKFILAQSARALEHLHAKSIIYRDMKPENLVLDASGNVKLVDFGLAKVLRGSETKNLDHVRHFPVFGPGGFAFRRPWHECGLLVLRGFVF